MRKNPLRTKSQDDYNNLNRKYPKLKFNLVDKPDKKDIDFKAKFSVLPSNFKPKFPKKVNSFLNLNNNLHKLGTNKSNKLMKQLSKASENDIPLAKSSLNVKNNLLTKTFIEKAKLAKTKSVYDTNDFNNPFKKTTLKKTKNNFLKLITKTNEGNYEREYSDLKNSMINNGEPLELEEEDSLEKVEKKLQDKLFDMGKEFEFMEFEVEPLDMTVNNFNVNRKKKKLISKKTKDFEGKKESKKKKFMTTAIRKKGNMLSQITPTNSQNAISDNLFFNKHRLQDLDDSTKTFIKEKNEKKNIHKHTNFLRKLKFGASNIKQSRISNNLKNSVFMGKNARNLNLYDKLTSIFKTNHPKFFPKKTTILKKSQTYSNIESKIGQTFITSLDSFEKSNSLTSEREMPIIDKEKFRFLSHKKLVYDSLDDEELIEDAVTENFYIMPNSYFIIIIDTMVLIFTFWSMVYKPLYLVLNNCDVQNTITSINFDNLSNIFIDALFIVDLIINFFKAYYNFDEQLITKTNQIFCHYIKGYFIIDLISAIPYYSIIKFIALNRYMKYGINPSCSQYFNHQINDIFQVIEVLKLLKVIKCISKNNIVTHYLLSILNTLSFFENWSYLIFNISLFFLLLHLTACIHIFISSTAYPNWIIIKNLNMSSFPTVYLSSIYFLITTVTSVGYGDITGNTFTEFCFQIVILLVGIIAYSWLISSLSNYVKENNSQNEIFSKKVNMLNEILLEHPNMPKELYDKIYLHLEYINLRHKKDKSSLIDSLPHTVKKSLLYEMYRPIIDNFNFFKNFKNSEFINKVISKLKPIIGVKNDILLEQGEIIEETFFVKQGRLSLEVKIDTNRPEKSVQKLLNEEYFFGLENNELYQQNAFGLANMTTIKKKLNATSINKDNNILNNLYNKNTIIMNNINQKEKEIKSVLTNDQGKGEIQNHQKFNTNCICLKILDIRKNEHFGALLMFLNKRSPLRLRVKTKKAELYFLKKIDAIEISSSYPNIWKRANRASFHNLKQIKKIMHKIIIHFCETYGINFMTKISVVNNIKDMNDLKQFYTIQNKLNKEYENNNFTVLNKNTNDQKMFSGLANKSQLRMLKEFISNNNSDSLTNKYQEKSIEQPELKDFDISKDISRDISNDISKDNVDENLSNNDTSFDKEDQTNCTLNKFKTEKKPGSSKKENTFNKNNNANSKNEINNSLSQENHESDETKTKDKNNKKINYGKEESKKLIKNYGTPYYPEDINDEIYPKDVQSGNSNDNNNNNVEELEYTPVNYLLSSQGSMKNNYIQTINELNIKGEKRNPSNVTINNNYITNNVINNIQPQKIKNELSIFHFNFNFKSTKEKFNIIAFNQHNNYTNKSFNFSISKNFFEITTKNKLRNRKKVKNKNNIRNRNNNDNNMPSSKRSHSSKSSDIKNNKLDKSFTCAIPLKKVKHSSSSSDNSSESEDEENDNKNKKLKIRKNKRFNYNSEYFNLNQLTKGKFSKNIKFQIYIKNIILEKLSDINHSKVELPRVRESLKRKISSSALPLNKKKISKKFSAFLPSLNFRNENKLKSVYPKNQKSNLIAFELNDKGNHNNITKKKITRKSANDNFLNHINRNIRDDSAVLNDPGKFYNGLFNGLMKKYTKANFKFPK